MATNDRTTKGAATIAESKGSREEADRVGVDVSYERMAIHTKVVVVRAGSEAEACEIADKLMLENIRSRAITDTSDSMFNGDPDNLWERIDAWKSERK
jgi:hypothetical protein